MSTEVKNPPIVDYDALCQHICATTPNCMIVWYLMASYAYEKLDQPIITDACYDELGKRLYAEFDKLEHPHKALIDLSQTNGKASSLAVNFDALPNITKDSVVGLIRQMNQSHKV